MSRVDGWQLNNLTGVDAVLSKLSFATIGMILRGSDYAEDQNMDKDQEQAAAKQADIQIEAHQD